MHTDGDPTRAIDFDTTNFPTVPAWQRPVPPEVKEGIMRAVWPHIPGATPGTDGRRTHIRHHRSYPSISEHTHDGKVCALGSGCTVPSGDGTSGAAYGQHTLGRHRRLEPVTVSLPPWWSDINWWRVSAYGIMFLLFAAFLVFCFLALADVIS